MSKNAHEKSTEIFAHAPIPKAVLTNVIPSVISMLMVLVYNLADTYFIGQTKNALMVAAVSLATPVFLIFMAVGMLFGIGGTSLISRRLGQKREKDAKAASSFCFWTGLGVGILSMVMIWIFSKPISTLVGANHETLELTSQYLDIVALGIPFLIVGNIFSNIIRAEGNPKVAMLGMIVGNLVNIVLDPIMILGLGWNVAGAAAATTIGNVVAASLYLYHLIRKSPLLSIKLKDYRARAGIATGVLAIGIPASLNSVLMSVSNIVVNKLMAQYGNMAVAGLGVAMKVNMIAVMLLIGVGTGIQPLLGYNYGARNRKRFVAALRFSVILAVGVGVVMTAICFIGSKGLVHAFLSQPDASAYGVDFVHILMMSGPILGILFVFINTIQAMGAAVPSLVLSISRQGIVYIPIIFIFNMVSNSERLLVSAQPITDVFATALSIGLFLFAFRRTNWEQLN